MPLVDWESLPKRKVASSSNPITQRILAVVKAKGRVQIQYSGGGKNTIRWIKPKRVFTVQSARWPGEYVEAFCELRNENRVFEVQHIALQGETVPNKARAAAKAAKPGPVRCEISFVDLDGDHGSVEGVQAECLRCGHVTESFGTDSPSVLRCLALMREECPNNEQNFYVED